MRRLTLFAHGGTGTGKSWLFNSMPGPRILFDAEGRADYLADLRADPSGLTPQRLVYWDPTNPVPEESSDPDVVTVINVSDLRTLRLGYQWLSAGDHPFESVGIDSLQELQFRLIDETAGADQMKTQDWGTVLRELDALIRKFRDLRKNPKSPVNVLVVAGSRDKDGVHQPMLQGQMADRAPYHFDVVGFMRKGRDGEGNKVRYMTIDGYEDGIIAKDNTHTLTAKYGEHIPFPDISTMLDVLNNPTVEVPRNG